MANVKINNVTYSAVPSVSIPNASGTGNATFWDTSSATGDASKVLSGYKMYNGSGEVTGDASKVLSGYKMYNGSGEVTGDASMPSISQDASSKVLTIA